MVSDARGGADWDWLHTHRRKPFVGCHSYFRSPGATQIDIRRAICPGLPFSARVLILRPHRRRLVRRSSGRSTWEGFVTRRISFSVFSGEGAGIDGRARLVIGVWVEVRSWIRTRWKGFFWEFLGDGGLGLPKYLLTLGPSHSRDSHGIVIVGWNSPARQPGATLAVWGWIPLRRPPKLLILL